ARPRPPAGAGACASATLAPGAMANIRTRSRRNGCVMAGILAQNTPMKRGLWWASWIPSGLGVFIILTSLRWKLTRSPFYVTEWRRIGYPDTELLGIALVQLTCLALYLMPPTSILGMVLFTGYLGGAIASYVRMREPNPVLVPLTTCLLLW